MSKWSKRTPEEQARILADQEALRDKARQKTPEYKFGAEHQTEILSKNEIPLVCEEHGFTTSERYELVKEKHPLLRQEMSFVKGKCIKCGRIAKRALQLDESGMMLMLIVRQLQEKGRLDDRR
jgi:hypothetical protein